MKLPNWEPRQSQIETLDSFDKCIKRNKKFLIVESPTGTGKSYSVMMMAQAYQKIKPNAKFDIITNTIILQNQYVRDFHEVATVKGKDNYHCKNYNCSCSEGAELAKVEEVTCHDCPFVESRNRYINSEVSVLNFHLYSSFHMYAEDILEKRGANILFIDEAHSLEKTFTDFIEGYISIPYLSGLGLKITKNIVDDFNSIKGMRGYAEFLKIHVMNTLSQKMNELTLLSQDSSKSSREKVEVLKESKHISRALCKLRRFLRDETNWESNWVMEFGTDDENEKFIKVSAVWGKKYFKEIWDRYEHIVMLSGTIIDKNFFMNLMGINISDVQFLTIDCPFPKDNRKIFYVNNGKFSYKEIEESFKNNIPVLKEIINKHKGHKGIIHTGNYKLAKWIQDNINDPRLLFHNSSNREDVISHHIATKEDTIIVSPSCINGLDLNGDLSRFQIILKIPFPNLDSEKVRKRMSSDNKWYQWMTACDIIQSYGRSVRSMEDWADTYILDGNFNNILNSVKMPKYFLEALTNENYI